MNTLINTVILGAGATALMDLWGLARRPLLGFASPDYSHVGRWIGHMPEGRFRHSAIGKAAPVSGESTIGWAVHYLIGITYAALLMAVAGTSWLGHPRLVPALLVGISTVVAPFLIMQPAVGAGIAASRAARPGLARLHSLIMHTVFGLGLYLTGLALLVVKAGP